MALAALSVLARSRPPACRGSPAAAGWTARRRRRRPCRACRRRPPPDIRAPARRARRRRSPARARASASAGRRRRSPAARCGAHSVPALPARAAASRVWSWLKHSGLAPALSALLRRPRRATPSGTARGPARLENSEASVPVMKVWQLSSSRIANKRRPPAGIEMRGDLVEQQDRRRAGDFGGQPRMRNDEPDQQRLLLAGRAELGRHVLRRVADQQVGAMRAVERAAGGAVARCGRTPAPRAAVSSTSTAGRSPICRSTAPSSAIEARGNGPSSGSLAIIADKQPHELASRRGDRHAGLGHLRLDGVEPGPVARILGEQAVASAHRLFVVERALPVVGIDRPAPAGRGSAGGRRPARRTARPWPASSRSRAGSRASPRPSARWRR